MLTIQKFTFNPFEENTYVLSDETSDCIILDPGCYDLNEKKELELYIVSKKFRPVRILLTHAHIDHILGVNYVAGRWDLPVQMCSIETGLLLAAPEYGKMWGLVPEPAPEPTLFIEEGMDLVFGNTTLKTIFTPGHSPGSFSFLHEQSGNLFSGDVLFQESIGRTDLPGGDYATLIQSIENKLFTLSDEIIVHPGHGPSTTIGYERVNNPFLNS